ncbi:OpgC domain-containing protein [Methylocapsa polymorpha]|uniref:OpgC domain-containing protein n=1 Tax=Methylocapsa polymorpha TaxID=3080828 RepID=A0ABZ0HLP7_9HYPH|nr:OpgC domain-containing protein [Methylocapsa sp. RX1]
MRPPNEIDFWRGFALLTIFINHIPGLYFERFTYRNVSLSDSAELFVFLAGWAMRKLIEGPARGLSAGSLILRLEGRATTVYVAQTVITEIAIALLAAASILLDAPFLTDWHNASAVFNDPVRAHIGLVLLTHQLGYFNILPLYVVLVFIAPLIALAHRHARRLLLPVSFAIYAVALAFGLNLPTWPVEGTWFFNPLAWQLIYVLGFVLAGEDGLGGFARRKRKVFWWLALPVVLLAAAAAIADFSPDPFDVPSPKLWFMFDKTFLSPARLIHSLALTALFAGAFATIGRWTPRASGFLSLLGRNSLNVFCAASILSLAGQILRFAYSGNVATDAFIVIVGFLLMGLVAWLSEWRSRLPAAPAFEPRSPSGSSSS